VNRIEELRLEGRIPQEDNSVYADEGTTAHEHLSGAFLMGFNPALIPDPFMAIHIKKVVDYLEGFAGPEEIHVEERVPLFYSTDDGGTVDAWVHVGDHLHIADLKYGEGIAVDAEGNTQLAIYAESLIQSGAVGSSVTMDTLVSMHIMQPRCREGEPFKQWTITRRELQDFTDPIWSSAKQHQDNVLELPCTAGPKQCMFCPVKKAGLCAEHIAWAAKGLPPEIKNAVVTDSVLPDIGTLTHDQIASIAVVVLRGNFASWMKRVGEYALDQVVAGNMTVPGYKAVKGRKNKSWTDEIEVAKLLKQKLRKDQMVSEKLLTPTQAEALLVRMDLSSRWKNKFYSLVDIPEGAPTFAKDSDKREALTPPTAESEFGDLL